MKKILVVEDDKFLSSAYRLKLTKAGFEVKLASDGNEALNTLVDYTPDLILLDLIMPVKDGFAVLAELHANPLWKTIPVIVASNLGQKEDVDKSKQLGASDFIIKSDLSLESVINKINVLLKIPIAPAVAQTPIATLPEIGRSSSSIPPTPSPISQNFSQPTPQPVAQNTLQPSSSTPTSASVTAPSVSPAPDSTSPEPST